MRMVVWLIAVLCCLAAEADDKLRTWTEATGRTMEAQFVREIDGDATFLKDGKLITIPLDRLTEKDQKLIRDIEAGKKVQPDQPPAGATSRDNGVPPDDSPAENGGDKGRPNLTTQKVVAENREWRDTNGWQVTAKFVRYHEGNVILNRLGRVVSMPFDSLTPADQRYVRTLLTAKGDAAQLPPATPAELGTDAGQGLPLPPRGPFGASPADFDSRLRDEGSAADQASLQDQPDRFALRTNHPDHSSESRDGAADKTHESQSKDPATSSARAKLTSHVTMLRQRPPLTALLVGMPIGLAIGSLIGAILLRVAVSWVLDQEVAFAEAYVTALLAYTVNALFGFGIGLVFSALTQSVDGHHLLSLFMMPISFLIQSSVIASRLDTDYGSACLVTLVMILISMVIAVVVGTITFTLFMAGSL